VMPPLRACLSVAIVLLGAVSSVLSQAVSGGGIGGRLTDDSGLALPGVTVSMTCAGSSAVIIAVTDSAGTYAVTGLPSGPCKVVFELAGFQKIVRERIEPAGQVVAVDQQLGLAGIEETVNVVAAAPAGPVAAAKPHPRVQPESIPPHDAASVCGSGPLPFADRLIRLVGDRDGGVRTMYAPGDRIVIDAGRANGIAVGQNYVVRRPYRSRDVSWGSPVASAGVHSAGLVQVVEVEETRATVAVVYACDEFVRGDDLDVFAPEPFRPPRSDGPPDFAQPARVLLGDEGRMLGAPGRTMVIDQGTDAGVEVGQWVTLFRRTQAAGAVLLAEAVVVAARADWSRIRIDSVRDVVYAGDLAAPHRRSGSVVPPARRLADGPFGGR
jgi:hypothetical protein